MEQEQAWSKLRAALLHEECSLLAKKSFDALATFDFEYTRGKLAGVQLALSLMRQLQTDIKVKEVLFDAEDIQDLAQQLTDVCGKNIAYRHEKYNVMFDGAGVRCGVKLELSLVDEARLVVSELYFADDSMDTTTRVMGLIERYCVTHSIQAIVIEVAEAPALAEWCTRNGFIPIALTAVQQSNVTAGRYIKQLK